MVFNIFYKLFKCYVLYEGGIVDLVIIFWFNGIVVYGEICDNYVNVSDIMFIVYDLLGMILLGIVKGIL